MRTRSALALFLAPTFLVSATASAQGTPSPLKLSAPLFKTDKSGTKFTPFKSNKDPFLVTVRLFDGPTGNALVDPSTGLPFEETLRVNSLTATPSALAAGVLNEASLVKERLDLVIGTTATLPLDLASRDAWMTTQVTPTKKGFPGTPFAPSPRIPLGLSGFTQGHEIAPARVETKELAVTDGAATGRVLTSDAQGNATWSDLPFEIAGTAGRIPVFVSGSEIGNSVIAQSSGAVAIGGNTSVTGSLAVSTLLAAASSSVGSGANVVTSSNGNLAAAGSLAGASLSVVGNVAAGGALSGASATLTNSLNVGAGQVSIAGGSIAAVNAVTATTVNATNLFTSTISAAGNVTASAGFLKAGNPSTVAQAGDVVADDDVLADDDVVAGGAISAGETITAGSSIVSTAGFLRAGNPTTAAQAGDVVADDDVLADDAVVAGGNVIAGGFISATANLVTLADVDAGDDLFVGDDAFITDDMKCGAAFLSEGALLSQGAADTDFVLTSFDDIVLKKDILSAAGREFQVFEGANDIQLRLQANGNLRIDGTLTTGGADAAEYFPTADATLASMPGALVAVDPDRAEHVVLARRGVAEGVLGIVTSKPGLVLGAGEIEGLHRELVVAAEAARERGDFAAAQVAWDAFDLAESLRADRVAVALAGRVPVLVDGSGGTIAPGERLGLGSEPGRAARYSGTGPVVGIALEAWHGAKPAVIAFVHLDWSPDALYQPFTRETSGRAPAVLPSEGAAVAGSVVFAAGATELVVRHEAIRADAQPSVTFFGNPGSHWWVSQRGNGWFVLTLQLPAPADVEVGYRVDR